MIDLYDKPGLNQDKFISLLNGCVVGSGKLQFMRDAWKFMWKLIGACNFDLATLNSFLQFMKVWASFWLSQETHLNWACVMQNVMGSRPSPSYTFYQYVLITLYFITSLSYSVYFFQSTYSPYGSIAYGNGQNWGNGYFVFKIKFVVFVIFYT